MNDPSDTGPEQVRELVDLSRDLREHLVQQRAWGGLFPTGPAPIETLASIRDDLGDCRRCALAPTRGNLVFGEGSPHADLAFVGEAVHKGRNLRCVVLPAELREPLRNLLERLV